jgi:hypothetical protein
MIAKVISLIVSVRWSDVFSGIWQGMQSVWDKITSIVVNAWHFIHDIEWGNLFMGIGKSLANGLISLIEGALKGALKGLPGNIESSIHLPRFAAGTNYAPGGASIVGENGPEIVNLPRGSSVTPNNQIGSSSVINLYMEGIMARSRSELRDIAKDMITAVNEELRAKGKTELAI